MNKGRIYLSLRMKVFFSTSVILLGVAFLYFFISSDELNSRLYEQQIIDFRKQKFSALNSISNSEMELQNYASIAASSKGLGQSIVSNDDRKISDALNFQWPTLQLDVGVSYMLVFNNKGDVVREFGRRFQKTNGERDEIKKWGMDSLSKEKPTSHLICNSECRIYSFAPVLLNGRSVGVVMLSSTVADVVRFLVSGGAENVAILSIKDESEQNGKFDIMAWQANIIAITGKDDFYVKVLELSKKVALSKIVDRPYESKFDDGVYHYMAFPLERKADDTRFQAFILASYDVTSQFKRVEKDSIRLFYISFFGWLFSEIVLWVILSRPMKMLQDLTRLIPLLAEERFDDFKHRLKVRNGFFYDEAECLRSTIIEVIDKIEMLQEKLIYKNNELRGKLIELDEQKRFSDSLLSAANTLIVAHEFSQGVFLVNDHAEKVTGLKLKNISGKRFNKLFSREESSFDYKSQTSFQEESVVMIDGQVKYFDWYHSPLDTSAVQKYWISIGVDITDKKIALEKLEWLANRDALTGLYNRRFFEEKSTYLINKNKNFSIFYLDLNQFKDVNELGGHAAGDELLCMVADKLKVVEGDGVFISRFGGDEFALISPATEHDDVVKISLMINSSLEDINYVVGNSRFSVSASIGIANFPRHGSNFEEIMSNADCAMYIAKSNPLCVYYIVSDKDLSKEDLRSKIYFRDLVRRSLEQDSFTFYVQPIVDTFTLSIRHYEVLVRLKEDNGRLISPGNFIPILERSNQIIDLDRHVVEKVILFLRRIPSISLAVNVSGKTLLDEFFSDFLSDLLDEHDIDPARLIVEVTETEAVTDFSKAILVLDRIKAIGCKVALDDFGAGFSSFKYLDKLPSDFIKIDGEFVVKMKESVSSRVIVKSICDMSRPLGKVTIAEYVEDEETLSSLREIGVDYIQGYYNGLPFDIKKLVDGN